jgi:hypothetical protein
MTVQSDMCLCSNSLAICFLLSIISFILLLLTLISTLVNVDFRFSCVIDRDKHDNIVLVNESLTVRQANRSIYHKLTSMLTENLSHAIHTISIRRSRKTTNRFFVYVYSFMFQHFLILLLLLLANAF